jgi:uncharacterized protein (TIGR00661 family)
MTQSLALKHMVEDAGHEVVAVFSGENPHRPIPAFVRRHYEEVLHTYPAPNFSLDKKAKGVRPWVSLLGTFPRIPQFIEAGPEIHRRMKAAGPDLIVNFYDLFGGLYSSLFRPGIPTVALAHQFLFFHPDFPTVKDKRWEIEGVKINSWLSSLGADLRLALSFSPLPDLPEQRIKVVPPLLRGEILEEKPRSGSHVLAYVLNPGYAEELDRWHRDHPGVDLHCFWDRADVPDTYSPRENLTFHRLSDEIFVHLLSTCRGYTSTAGFESLCEAAFLGKPVMVVPTGNHVEQRCNALDAERAGIAIWREAFDLTDFMLEVDSFDPRSRDGFRRWVEGSQEVILPLLEVAWRRGDFWQV